MGRQSCAKKWADTEDSDEDADQPVKAVPISAGAVVMEACAVVEHIPWWYDELDCRLIGMPHEMRAQVVANYCKELATKSAKTRK